MTLSMSNFSLPEDDAHPMSSSCTNGIHHVSVGRLTTSNCGQCHSSKTLRQSSFTKTKTLYYRAQAAFTVYIRSSKLFWASGQSILVLMHSRAVDKSML